MIIKLLSIYNIYIIFTPLILFWLSHILKLLELLIKLFKKNGILPFPKETDSFTINTLIVYPQRIAFDYIYRRDFVLTKDFLYKLIKILSIVLIIGIPFFVLRILYTIFKTRSLLKTWIIISPYQNKKLIIRDYIVYRNMKSSSNFISGSVVSGGLKHAAVLDCKLGGVLTKGNIKGLQLSKSQKIIPIYDKDDNIEEIKIWEFENKEMGKFTSAGKPLADVGKIYGIENGFRTTGKKQLIFRPGKEDIDKIGHNIKGDLDENLKKALTNMKTYEKIESLGIEIMSGKFTSSEKLSKYNEMRDLSYLFIINDGSSDVVSYVDSMIDYL